MILSHRYRFLFVHIAKTGGSSVRSALRKYRWRDPMSFPMWVGSRMSHLTHHKTATKLPRHAGIICAQEMLEREFFDSLFKFAIIRNPWDLQVSSWHHLQRIIPDVVAHCADFDHFVRWKLDTGGRAWHFDVDTSIKLQLDYVCDLHRNVLTDFLGRYESLQEDFDHICDTIGIPRQALPRKNTAGGERKKDYREYYSDDLAELVGEHFREDVEAFGYGFDPA